MTTTTTIRDCAHCGDSIIVTSRNPNRRFCSMRCRRADWNDSQPAGRKPTDSAADAVPSNAVGVPAAVRNDVPDDGRPGNAVPRPNAVTRCPHCHKRLTVLTWLLPPAAAHVTTPDHG